MCFGLESLIQGFCDFSPMRFFSNSQRRGPVSSQAVILLARYIYFCICFYTRIEIGVPNCRCVCTPQNCRMLGFPKRTFSLACADEGPFLPFAALRISSLSSAKPANTTIATNILHHITSMFLLSVFLSSTSLHAITGIGSGHK